MPKKKNEEIKQNDDSKKNEEQSKENNANQKLGWVQILLLLGKPVWDEEKKKWRVLNGYQSVLGDKNNQMFFEVTFTDTPYWENFVEKQLYMDIPKEQKASKEDGITENNKKGKRAKT